MTKRDKNIAESALDGKRQSDLITTLSVIPFLEVILFFAFVVLFPFKIKKYLKWIKQKDKVFW
ncbi:MAG: hypothetical protein PT934_01695 [Peptoniphilaceae bacterium]|uniref:hypothetical protein n=1 Tax=Parvimonas sp. TaxID=1944660 RepID=UPI002A764216|nr:hypothetical protein [Parvimonas sp.]MDD7764462.1 hypothetical protein [Peptoniphilaceae bacterium]MDY3051137.1 hypothetical protein [Parvimonas sp.]